MHRRRRRTSRDYGEAASGKGELGVGGEAVGKDFAKVKILSSLCLRLSYTTSRGDQTEKLFEIRLRDPSQRRI